MNGGGSMGNFSLTQRKTEIESKNYKMYQSIKDSQISKNTMNNYQRNCKRVLKSRSFKK